LGKTDLPQLAKVLRTSKLTLCNETSFTHLGAALGTPVVYVLGGGHFGRFAPYPTGLAANVHSAVFHPMECYGCNWTCCFDIPPGAPAPCVERVTVEKVLESALAALTRTRSSDAPTG
jgi:ADP-heptose:LPS heptosyltransferase